MKGYKKRKTNDEKVTNAKKRNIINKKFKTGMECFEGYEYINHIGSGAFGTAGLYKDDNDNLIIIKTNQEIYVDDVDDMYDLDSSEEDYFTQNDLLKHEIFVQRERWKRESDILKRITDENEEVINIPLFYDAWECNEEDYPKFNIAMEYISGPTLQVILENINNNRSEENPPYLHDMSKDEIKDKVFKDLESTIETLATMNINHNDYQSINILWNEEQKQFFLIDLGSAHTTNIDINLVKEKEEFKTAIF